MTVIAIPTGRSYGECVEILLGAGLPAEALQSAGRNLVVDQGRYRYLLGKPSDIPTLISQGVAELALVGSDVIGESEVELTELFDTDRGRCFLAVAGPESVAERFGGHTSALMGLKVGTTYVKTARRTFESWGAQIKVLKLNGSVELAPALGVADCIFDVVQTGGTLRANGLTIIKRASDVSLRLVASSAALQLRWRELRETVEAIRRYILRGA